MIRAVLMDFNGVIINDEPLQMQAYRKLFEAEGISLTDEEYYSCTGMDDMTFITHNFKRAGKKVSEADARELSKKKTEVWRGIIDKGVPLFPGVDNFIKKCDKRFAMGLVSMAKREEIEYVLEKTGLRKSFTKLVTAEDVKNCKPNPECYNIGFKYLDAKRMREGHYPLMKRECLVIEDVPQGIKAGKAAGMPVLAVTNTFDADTLRKAGANSVTPTLSDWMPDSLVQTFK